MGFLNLPGIGKLHYNEYGSGDKPLLAFHGYGMTGRQFHVLDKSILTQYHVFGIDHFFHGDSKVEHLTEQQIISGMPKTVLKSLVKEWFNIYGRQRFSVMGYSIGANFALTLVEEFPDLIDEIILMAPDGLAVYKGFHFLLHQKLGQFLFRQFTKSKWLAPAVLKILKKIHVIDESLYHIAYNEIDTEQKRLDVYYTLNFIKNLRPDTARITSLINEHHIKCVLIFGKHDKLFPKASAMPFINRLNNPTVYEVSLGHWLVTPALDEYLLKQQP